MNDFTGLRALVTGGGSGIGAATARPPAARGAEVAVLDLDPPAAYGHRADVGDDASVRAAVAAAAGDLGGATRGPAIVDTCSIAATAGPPRHALYSASKGAVPSPTLAAGHVHEDLRVNPGTADTPCLASPAAASTTGTALTADDGMQGLRPRPGGR